MAGCTALQVLRTSRDYVIFRDEVSFSLGVPSWFLDMGFFDFPWVPVYGEAFLS